MLGLDLSLTGLASRTRGVAAASMPAGALGIWWFDQYSATPRPTVPNAVDATPVSARINPAPRRLFNSGTFWNVSGGTVVDGGIADPFSGNDASRFTVSGDFYLITNDNLSYPSATYTIALWAKRNTGSDQSYKLGFWTGGGEDVATVTATAIWQRFTHTTTVAGGKFTGIKSVDGATGVDIQIIDLEIFAGAADLGTGAVPSHLAAGVDPFSPPTFDGAALDFSSSKSGLIQFPSGAVSMSEFTAFALAKKVASGSSEFQFAMSDAGGANQLLPPLDVLGTLDVYFGGDGGLPNASGLWEMFGDEFHVIASRFKGGVCDVFVDDVRLRTGTFSPTVPVTAVDYKVALYLNSHFTKFKISALALYPSGLTDAQVRTAAAIIKARAVADALTVSTLRIFAAEGNSQTAGANSWAYRFGANSSPRVYGVNYAVNGTSISDAVDRAVALDATVPPSPGGRKFILGLLWALLPEDLVELAAYCDARRAAGWTVVLATFPPNTIDDETTWNAFNTAIRGWVGVHVDAVADIAGDPDIGSWAAAADTDWYSDGTHLTAAGQARAEEIFRAVINGL